MLLVCSVTADTVAFLPGQRLSGGAPYGQPGAPRVGCALALGSSLGWVVVVVVVVVVTWGLRVPRPCGAGQRTSRGI